LSRKISFSTPLPFSQQLDRVPLLVLPSIDDVVMLLAQQDEVVKPVEVIANIGIVSRGSRLSTANMSLMHMNQHLVFNPAQNGFAANWLVASTSTEKE